MTMLLWEMWYWSVHPAHIFLLSSQHSAFLPTIHHHHTQQYNSIATTLPFSPPSIIITHNNTTVLPPLLPSLPHIFCVCRACLLHLWMRRRRCRCTLGHEHA